jgi:hypothetical protein
MSSIKRLLWAAASIVILPAIGCGEAYTTAEVDGVVTIKGEPGHKIFVQFTPDFEHGTQGPQSFAETNAKGKFTLELRQKDGTPLGKGAIVGWHRVVLSDQQLAESATGAGLPIRLPPEYSLPGSTPLTQEVKAGKQEITIEIP